MKSNQKTENGRTAKGTTPDPKVAHALERGRNANDNFADDQTDDYGLDTGTSQGMAEQQQRDQIKGGTGGRGVGRNRNDDFNNGK